MSKRTKQKPEVDHAAKWRAAGIKAAITLLERNGYRVTKAPAKKPTIKPNGTKNGNGGLNAIGRPYSPGFDPKYRMKHKPSYAHLYKPGGKFNAVSPERWTEMCANAKAHWNYSRKHGTPLPFDMNSPLEKRP